MSRPLVRWRRALVAVITVGLAEGLLVAPAGGAVAQAVSASKACPRALSGSTPPMTGQSSGARPVVLVHGWTGEPLQATAADLQARLGAKISTFTFDYAKYAADWPTNLNIAPCLAEYVGQVSAAYKSVGGDGKVILVAHSMGGLAIRYASSSDYTTDPITATEAPLVISLDTPYLGSPWGGTALALAKELGDSLFSGGSAAMPNPFGTDGAACLRPHSNGQGLPTQCGGLPPWLPSGIALDQIGGDITVNRTLLGVQLYKTDTHSDVVVPLSSSLGYQASGAVGSAVPPGATVSSQAINCTVNSGIDLSAALAAMSPFYGGPGMVPIVKSVGGLIDQLGVLESASCSHIKIVTARAAISAVAADIRAYLAGNPSRAPGQPVTLPVTSWTPVGGAVITAHNDGTFEVTYGPTYWGGIIASTNVGCNYRFSGQGRVIAGGGYGLTAWASVDSQGVPHGQAIQYDLGIGGYRDTNLPTASESGPVQNAAVDNGWHSISIQVVNGRYTSTVDGVTIFSGTMAGSCTNQVFIRLWNSDDVEFRDLSVTALKS